RARCAAPCRRPLEKDGHAHLETGSERGCVAWLTAAGRSASDLSSPPPMNLLKSVETTIANLVEGTFGRVFRSEVRPMELARKLAREMDAHRTVSVSRVYVPNEYSVWLSPRDRDRYEGVEGEVIDELCAYLLEHARREDLILASQPHIVF